MPLPDGLLVIVLLMAVVTDLWRQKIYNWLTFPGILIGLILSLWQGASPLFLNHLGATVFVTTLLFPVFALRGLKAGDVKLFAAVAAIKGWPFILPSLLASAIAGGVCALLWATFHGKLFASLQRVYYFFLAALTPGMSPKATVSQSETPPFPYGIAIAIGTALILWYPDLIPLPPLIAGSSVQ